MSVFSKRKTGIFHFVFEKKRYNKVNKRVCTDRGATALFQKYTKDNGGNFYEDLS